MTLSPKAKKIIVISSCSVLTVGLLIWYIFPVLAFYFYCYRDSSLRKALYIKPVAISTLERPPQDWTVATIGELSVALPLFRYTKASGKESYIAFTSGKGHLIIADLVPLKGLKQTADAEKLPYPPMPFKVLAATYNSTPVDISIFHTRAKNTGALMNQILKLIAMPAGGLGSLSRVDTQTLKALCLVSERSDKGYLAEAYVFSKNEKSYVHLTFLRYEDKTALEADLFAVLAGMRMPDHMNDSVRVSEDIDRIVKQFERKE